MGIKKISGSELLNFNKQKTDAGIPKKDGFDVHLKPKKDPTSPRLDTIKAILASIDAPSQLWPKEAFKAILKRFERMPRNGWNLLHSSFSEKFGMEITLAKFKKDAQSAIVSESGRSCTQNESDKESTNKKQSTEENSLRDLKLYTKARDQLLLELGNIMNTKVSDVPRTRKVSSESLDGVLLEMLNQAIGEVILDNPIQSWTDIAHMIQATQLAYQSLTSKPRTKSNWKENILKKIENARSSEEILIKARDKGLKLGAEMSKGRKIMRDLGLVLERKDDLIGAISKLNERASVFQRKLDTHEKRKEFSKVNRRYELQRSQFYRDLPGGDKTSIDVEEEIVKDFWSSMWNSNSTDETKQDYSDYLRECIPNSKEQKEYFPSMSEFSEIVKFLPSWNEIKHLVGMAFSTSTSNDVLLYIQVFML